MEDAVKELDEDQALEVRLIIFWLSCGYPRIKFSIRNFRHGSGLVYICSALPNCPIIWDSRFESQCGGTKALDCVSFISGAMH